MKQTRPEAKISMKQIWILFDCDVGEVAFILTTIAKPMSNATLVAILNFNRIGIIQCYLASHASTP